VKLAAQWHFVHIEHLRRVRELDATFHRLLVTEFEAEGEPADCRVYRRTGPDGGYTYFFSPAASVKLGQFVKFWGGVPCSEPTNLLDLEVVL
jgi:hypothetical protein